MFTPTHLDQLAISMRERSAECLDNLPKNEVFGLGRPRLDRPDHADARRAVRFPLGDRRKLTRWSDVATTIPGPDGLLRRKTSGRLSSWKCRDLFQQALEKSASISRRRATCCRMMAHARPPATWIREISSAT